MRAPLAWMASTSLFQRDLLVGIHAGRANHPRPAIEMEVASEMMSPPSVARCE